MNISEEDLVGALTGRDGLFSFLQNKLNWPLESEDTDYFLFKEAEDRAGRVAAKAALDSSNSRMAFATS